MPKAAAEPKLAATTKAILTSRMIACGVKIVSNAGVDVEVRFWNEVAMPAAALVSALSMATEDVTARVAMSAVKKSFIMA